MAHLTRQYLRKDIIHDMTFCKDAARRVINRRSGRSDAGPILYRLVEFGICGKVWVWVRAIRGFRLRRRGDIGGRG